MSAPIHLVISAPSAAPASTRRDCPLCDRISLPGFKPACTPCRKKLPRRMWLALAAAWDEGRGAESAEFAVAIGAAESHLAKAAGAL